MRKRYLTALAGMVLAAALMTGCGAARGSQSSGTGSGSDISGRTEEEMQAEIDSLRQELDELKNAQEQSTAENGQSSSQASSSDQNSAQASSGDQGTAGQTAEDSQSGTGNMGGSDVQISQEEAQNIALERVPGATAQHISIELEYDDGWYIYEGDILYNRTEYEFEIDANTGTILKWEQEQW
ncbi:PepSY domain-containing protein [Ruminococcus sp. CLA-AA-H200]|uniref:PepSY domain-containing protein n=1 Tax=Ruminococcus turbiniformis TaxID=2881258 RepID=A0ABS8FUZ0_9FIRM|nr:PepSY domain-containing protein [Ruminococcus turbiniformis]MCC2253863.1 PepSY domain-containing protein [Ruminococcus turbiniformis]